MQEEREAPAQDYSKHIGSSIYTVGHLQQEGSDQACVDAAVAQFSCATGTTFWVM
jgi:hypothetical protein